MKASYYRLPFTLRLCRFISKFVYAFIAIALMYAATIVVYGKIKFDIPIHEHAISAIAGCLQCLSFYIPIRLLIKRKTITRDLGNYFFLCDIALSLIPTIREFINFIHTGTYAYGISIVGNFIAMFLLIRYNDKQDDRLASMPPLFADRIADNEKK